jgi:hypothetical protein
VVRADRGSRSCSVAAQAAAFVERATAALGAAGFPAPQALRAAGALMAFLTGLDTLQANL